MSQGKGDEGRTSLEKLVLEFQVHVRAPPPKLLSEEGPREDRAGVAGAELFLLAASTLRLSTMAKRQALKTKDNRLLRAELMLEELAEVLKAMCVRDELELLDGLADLMYVTVGTAVSYSLPVEDAFREVHRSNMTKEVGLDHAAGKRGKGDGFSPPDLAAVLAARR